MSIPNDPFMLMSYLNTQLRDFYPNLRSLCDDKNIDEAEIISKLSASGFEYDEKLNRFL